MQNIKLRSGILMLAIVVTAAIAGCSSDDGADEDLVGRTWNLFEYRIDDRTFKSVGNARINFDSGAGVIGGSTGCNTYSGEYSADGDSISIGPVAATEIGCTTPPGIMEQEVAFLRLLPAATRFAVNDGELRLTSSDGFLSFR